MVFFVGICVEWSLYGLVFSVCIELVLSVRVVLCGVLWFCLFLNCDECRFGWFDV